MTFRNPNPRVNNRLVPGPTAPSPDMRQASPMPRRTLSFREAISANTYRKAAAAVRRVFTRR